MEVWSRESVLALAPDAGSRSAAVGAASGDAWQRTGVAQDLIWGRCRGSGQALYQTAVAFGHTMAYACTCPSRKFPCKHALGLLLQWSAGAIGPGEPPEYAAALRARALRRIEREPGPARVAKEVADPAAAAKRAADRAERVAAGFDELDQWLRDQVRGGLAGLERAGYAHFEAIAARMVDAQATGPASMLRAIPTEFGEAGWPERVLERLAALHLLVEAHRRLDRLPVPLADTVRARVGYPISKADVLARPGQADQWFAAGMIDTVEFRLETRRVWLYGHQTGRWAQLLSFAPPGGDLDSTVTAGQRVDATVHFYPGSGQLRALVGSRKPDVPGAFSAPPAESFAALRERFARLLADDPWASRMPGVLRVAPVRPEQPGGRWLLREESGQCCAAIELGADPWPLLARSGGDPIPVFGEWTGSGFRPLSLLPDGRCGFSTAVELAA